MAVTVRLDRRTEDRLRVAARRRGVTRSEVIREALRAGAKKEKKEASEGNGPSMYERWRDVVGIEQGGPPDLSERTGEKVARMLRERHRRSR